MSFFTNENKDVLDHAILELIYCCGLRVSECCKLNINQVNLDQKLIRVIGKGDKKE